MSKTLNSLVLAALLAVAPSAAHAQTSTFFGQDTNNGAVAAARPNADAARAAFLAGLATSGTQTFERLAVGSPAGTFGFGNAALGTATAAGNATISNGNSGDAFAISPTNYLLAQGALSFAFSAPVQAFGFYVTDFGDSGVAGSPPLSLTLTDTNGAISNLTVARQLGAVANGNVLFFGFIDPTLRYRSVAFNGFSDDEFGGLDDLTVGTLAAAAAVPEVSIWAMMIAGLGAVGSMLRRRITREILAATA